MMRTLAYEWAEFGIRLNCVAPGTIKTEALGRYPIPPEDWVSSTATCWDAWAAWRIFLRQSSF
ncbi:SDR family oxidoreductase [Afipia sp. DC4300-2b1]|uniref:SDR family oxidoreductase n=1 Tax=Afipia sp. DC4300-2b1 TaxID=2804672 RepID=UPI003CF6A97B